MDGLFSECPQPSCSCFPFLRRQRTQHAGGFPDSQGRLMGISIASRSLQGDIPNNLNIQLRQDWIIGEALPQANHETRLPMLKSLPKKASLESSPSVGIILENDVQVIAPVKAARAQTGSGESEESGSPMSERGANGSLTGLSQQLACEQLIVPPASVFAAPNSTASPDSSRTSPTNHLPKPQRLGSCVHPHQHQYHEGNTQVVHVSTIRENSYGIPSRKPSSLSRPQRSEQPAAVSVNYTNVGGHLAVNLSPSNPSSFTMARSNTDCVVALASSHLSTLPSALSHPPLAITSEQRFQYPAGIFTGAATGGPDILSSILSEGCTVPFASSYLPSGELSRFQSLQGGISSVLNADTGHISTTAVEQLRQQILSEQQQGAGGRPIEVDNLEKVGQGSYGLVYRGVWQGAHVAIKYLVSSSTQQLQISATEALLSKLLAHPNVVQTFACKVVELTQKFFEGNEEGCNRGTRRVRARCSSGDAAEHAVSLAAVTSDGGDGSIPELDPVDRLTLGDGEGDGGGRIRRLHTAVAVNSHNTSTSTAPRTIASLTMPTIADATVTAPAESQPPPLSPPPRRCRCSGDTGVRIDYVQSPRNTLCSRIQGGVSGSEPLKKMQGAVSPPHAAEESILLVPPGTAAIALDIDSDTASDSDPDPAPDPGIAGNRRLHPPPYLRRLGPSTVTCTGTGVDGAEQAITGRVDGCGSGTSGSKTCESGSLRGGTARVAELLMPRSSPLLGITKVREYRLPSTCSDFVRHRGGGSGTSTTAAAIGIGIGGADSCLVDLGTNERAAATVEQPAEAAEAAPFGNGTAVVTGYVSEDRLAEVEVLESFQSGDGFGAPYLAVTDRAHPLQDAPAKYRELIAQIQAKPGDFLTQIVMEFCDRGSLQRAIDKNLFRASSRWNARVALRAMLRTAREIAQGMCHLHASQIVHGDLKPANVLLKSSRSDRRGFIAKVADFGLSKIVQTTQRSSLECPADATGTIAYMAPEVLNGSMSPAADIYSFGVMLWQLVTSEKPFADLHPGRVFVGVRSGALRLEWPTEVHPMVRKLGDACLSFDKRQRPSFTKVARVLGVIETVVRNESAAAAVTSAAMAASASSAAMLSAETPGTISTREISGIAGALGPSMGGAMVRGGFNVMAHMSGMPMQLTPTFSALAAAASVASSTGAGCHMGALEASAAVAQFAADGTGAAFPAAASSATGAAGATAPASSESHQHMQQRLLISLMRTAQPVSQLLVPETGAGEPTGVATGALRCRQNGAASVGGAGGGSAGPLSPNTPTTPATRVLFNSPSASCSYSYSFPQAPYESSGSLWADPTPRSTGMAVPMPLMGTHQSYGMFTHGLTIEGSTAGGMLQGRQISAADVNSSGGSAGVMPVWTTQLQSGARLVATQAASSQALQPQPSSATAPAGADAHKQGVGGGMGNGAVLSAAYSVHQIGHHYPNTGPHGIHNTAAVASGGFFNLHYHHFSHGTSQCPHPHQQLHSLRLPAPGVGPFPVHDRQEGPPPMPLQQQARHQEQEQQRQAQHPPATPLPPLLPQQHQQEREYVTQQPVVHDPGQQCQDRTGHEKPGTDLGAACLRSISGLDAASAMSTTGAVMYCNTGAHDTGAGSCLCPSASSSARAGALGYDPALSDVLTSLQLPAGGTLAGPSPSPVPMYPYLPIYSLLHPQAHQQLSHRHQALVTHSHSQPNFSQPLQPQAWISVSQHANSDFPTTADCSGMEPQTVQAADVSVSGTPAPPLSGSQFQAPLSHMRSSLAGMASMPTPHNSVVMPKVLHAGDGSLGQLVGMHRSNSVTNVGAGATTGPQSRPIGRHVSIAMLQPQTLKGAAGGLSGAAQHHMLASPSPLCGSTMSPYFMSYVHCTSPSPERVCGGGGQVWPSLCGAAGGATAVETETAAGEAVQVGSIACGGPSSAVSATLTVDGSAQCGGLPGPGTTSLLVAVVSNGVPAGEGDLSLGALGLSGSAPHANSAANLSAMESTIAAVKLPDDYAFKVWQQHVFSPWTSSTWPFAAVPCSTAGAANVVPRPLVSLSLTTTSVVSPTDNPKSAVGMVDTPAPPPAQAPSHESYGAVAQPLRSRSSLGGGPTAPAASTVATIPLYRDRDRELSPAPHGLQRHAILEGDEEGL